MLGFGAVALQLATDDLAFGERRLRGDEATLHAEYAASEAISRVIEGEEAAYSGSGTVDGAAYQFSVTPSSADTWDIVGEAGSGIHSRTVTVELRRAAGDPDPDPDVAYVLWADEIEVNNVSGSLSGLIGATTSIDIINGSSIGTEQHLLNGATCSGCDNPVAITSYNPPSPPTPQNPGSCPYTSNDKIKNTTLSAGHYECSGNKLKLEGTISVTGPVVIFLDPGTKLEIKNAQINVGGDADDFQVVQSTNSTGKKKFDDSEVVGHLTMPEAYLEFKDDVAWTGRIVLDRAKFNRPDLDVDALPSGSGSGGGGGASSTSWHLDGWQLD